MAGSWRSFFLVLAPFIEIGYGIDPILDSLFCWVAINLSNCPFNIFCYTRSRPGGNGFATSNLRLRITHPLTFTPRPRGRGPDTHWVAQLPSGCPLDHPGDTRELRLLYLDNPWVTHGYPVPSIKTKLKKNRQNRHENSGQPIQFLSTAVRDSGNIIAVSSAELAIRPKSLNP